MTKLPMAISPDGEVIQLVLVKFHPKGEVVCEECYLQRQCKIMHEASEYDERDDAMGEFLGVKCSEYDDSDTNDYGVWHLAGDGQ